MSAWFAERIADAARLWAEGSSASEVASILNRTYPSRPRVSRNAVIGKLHRLGMARSPGATLAAARARSVSMRAKPKAPRITGPKIYNPIGPKVLGDKTPARKPNVETMEVGAVSASAPKPWEQRQPGECAWIVETGDAGPASCCAPICERGKLFSWCKDHARIGLGKMTGRGYYAPAEVFVERMGRLG